MNKAYPKYEKSDRVQRSDLSQVGQWMDGSRLVHVRPDGVKVFLHPHAELGSVGARFLRIHRLAKQGRADLSDPVSMQASLKTQKSENAIRHLKSIARIIEAHCAAVESESIGDKPMAQVQPEPVDSPVQRFTAFLQEEGWGVA